MHRLFPRGSHFKPACKLLPRQDESGAVVRDRSQSDRSGRGRAACIIHILLATDWVMLEGCAVRSTTHVLVLACASLHSPRVARPGGFSFCFENDASGRATGSLAVINRSYGCRNQFARKCLHFQQTGSGWSVVGEDTFHRMASSVAMRRNNQGCVELEAVSVQICRSADTLSKEDFCVDEK